MAIDWFLIGGLVAAGILAGGVAGAAAYYATRPRFYYVMPVGYYPYPYYYAYPPPYSVYPPAFIPVFYP